ncbi:Leucine-rich repeat protein kinase family protein [Rhynchospora pubera]|uniref:Leucine-rich repeat protein kinase family protein n=1 Tax=Rhynchospora pubera TaxID=906938 RepID=A0AAV8CEB3_9POAL|nr:Leucine-rich repeat protein kinase family protein [Rhynchospora pubera]
MASHHCRVGPLPAPALLLLAFCLLITPIQMQDLNSDASALLAFISSFGLTSVRWNQSKDTCTWQGITCQSGRVAELRLPGVGLRGDIPQSTLGNLTALRVLSLRFNALTGPIPPELGDISTLSVINLQRNKLTGEIPLTILSLPGLTQLNLAENQLSGLIAFDFAKLTSLQMLYLELNMFQGQLPDLNLTALSGFNVSFNELSGPIPPSLSRFDATSFLGMPLCGKPLPPCKGLAPVEPPVLPPTAFPPHASSSESPPHTIKKHGLSGGAIAGIVIGIAAVLLVAASIFILVLRRPEKSYTRAYQVESPHEAMALRAKEAMGSPTPTVRGPPLAARTAPAQVPVPVVGAAASPPRAVRPPQRDEDSGASAPKRRLVFFGRLKKTYDLEDLLRASAEVLGKGAFGTTYKAMLEMGQVVAVKRLKEVNTPEREFRDKITAIGTMEHPNVVPLRAYYYNRDEKLLVYDYMPMGSLSSLLHGNRGSGRPPLNWGTRSSIVLAAAHGLEYIHSISSQSAHGNIKASNILLSGTNNSSPEWARIADHGLAHLVGGPAAVPTRGGAFYKAPEVTDLRRASQKSDVYSFGVLLLELLTGRAPGQADGGVDLPRWVQQEFSDQLLDVELLRENQIAVQEMMRMMQLAMECVGLDPDRRPTMESVVRQIEDICDLAKSRSDSMGSSIDDTGERPLTSRSGKFL